MKLTSYLGNLIFVGKIQCSPSHNKSIKSDVQRLADAHSSLIIAKHCPHLMRALYAVWSFMIRVAVIAILLLTSSHVWSCSCSSPDLATKVAKSVVIVVGKVEQIEKVESDDIHQTLKGKIVVEETLKGEIANEFYLSTGPGVGDCGLGFKLGEKYIFFLRGEHVVTGCQGHIFDEKTASDAIFVPESLEPGFRAFPTFEEQLLAVKGILTNGI